MTNFTNTKKAIKETASDFILKGRSKIETQSQLFRAMRKQGYGEEVDLIKKTLAKISRRFVKFQNQLNKLQSPASPLKGAGFSRVEYFTENGLDIPSNHVTEVSYRRAKGYFGWNTAISPESDEILSQYSIELKKLNNIFQSIETPKDLQEKEMQKLAEILKDNKIKAKKEMIKNAPKNIELSVFFANEIHPAPANIYKLKSDSKMSWSDLRNANS